MKQSDKEIEKGYEILQPSILGGVYLWATDLALEQYFKNKWDKEVNEVLKKL